MESSGSKTDLTNYIALLKYADISKISKFFFSNLFYSSD